MICGALQTLNEEACEDVLDERDESAECDNNDVPITFVVPPSPDQSSQQGDLKRKNIVKIDKDATDTVPAVVNDTKDNDNKRIVPPLNKSKDVTVIIECSDDDDDDANVNHESRL